jgi:2-oxo-4-hydroxy-4-carboxy-5-ureidoimidazoline decarboxylase
MTATDKALEAWNREEQETAIETILPCNGSRAWAGGVVNLRPFRTPEDLFAASDEVWKALPERDWQEAFDSHPRLGERKAKSATAQSLSWSAEEQSAADSRESARAELAEGNRAYEAKFHRIFLLCATGLTTEEMVEILKRRLLNDAAAELRESVLQQGLITQLRLRKWLGLPSLSCAELAAK